MHWQKKNLDPYEVRSVAKSCGKDLLTSSIFLRRNIVKNGQIRFFLENDLKNLHNPFLFRQMKKAVDRINKAVRENEGIFIFGDRDVDGITSTVLLVETLRALGGRVQPYIPHRVDEGYGLNAEALSELTRDGISLVVTVDCGIRALDEVAHANRLGLDVIITDHHSVGSRLPRSIAVIDPQRGEEPLIEEFSPE